MEINKIAVLMVMAMATPIAHLSAAELDSEVAQAKKAIKSFVVDLKGELKSNLKAKGPVATIEICNKAAPEITKKKSARYAGTIGRTSLRLRNPKNAPDAWELATLKEFEVRKSNGESIKKIDKAEVVAQDGKRFFRYMKAIPTGEACVKCHGADIKSAVAKKLDALYPEDKARGFSKGDIRGAFTVMRPL